MDKLSRRSMLKAAGGTLGALSVLGVAAPARARAAAQSQEPAWTWPSSESVAGTGDGADPGYVWDSEADPVIARVLQTENVASINALLRTWTTNSQAVPSGLPGYLKDFIEQARQLPSWTDQGKLASAFEFIQKQGTFVDLIYGLDSGLLSCAIPHEARAVYYSLGGADMRERVTKTAKLGYDIGTENAYAPSGEMIVTAVKTRMVHAAVRHLLPQSPYWSKSSDEKIPISQRDILVTMASLSTTVMKKLTDWKVNVSTAESGGFLHLWQVTAHMLGVRDEYIPASWDAADSQYEELLAPVLGPTPEGANLAQILINLADQVDGGLVTPALISAFGRYMLGDQVADWIQLPAEPVWTPLIEEFWPAFVAAKEDGLVFPGSQDVYWAFDELLRQGTLLFLDQGQQISIELPAANRSM